MRGLSGGEDDGAPFPVRKEGREASSLLVSRSFIKSGVVRCREWVHDSLDELA